MFKSFISTAGTTGTMVAVTMTDYYNAAAAAVLLGILIGKKEKTMSDIFDNLIGEEAEITMFQDVPVRCRILEQDENFIKAEKIDRKAASTVMVFNKNLIKNITVKK